MSFILFSYYWALIDNTVHYIQKMSLSVNFDEFGSEITGFRDVKWNAIF
jgi:hypothetical protein